MEEKKPNEIVFWKVLTFLSEVDHPQENGDIPTEGIPSAN